MHGELQHACERFSLVHTPIWYNRPSGENTVNVRSYPAADMVKLFGAVCRAPRCPLARLFSARLGSETQPGCLESIKVDKRQRVVEFIYFGAALQSRSSSLLLSRGPALGP